MEQTFENLTALRGQQFTYDIASHVVANKGSKKIQAVATIGKDGVFYNVFHNGEEVSWSLSLEQAIIKYLNIII